MADYLAGSLKSKTNIYTFILRMNGRRTEDTKQLAAAIELRGKQKQQKHWQTQVGVVRH